MRVMCSMTIRLLPPDHPTTLRKKAPCVPSSKRPITVSTDSSRGRRRIVIEHITRIHPSCAPDWPQPDQGVGDRRVIIDGDPQLTIVTRADVPGGTRADGGNTTAANRLLGALNWLVEQKPGIYDGLQVPLRSALAADAEAARWAD